MTMVYVSPLGSGDQSGSSAANAAAFGQLNAAIQSAGPGGAVLLLADQGVYNTTGPVLISSGGADGAPVTIKGVDSSGNAMDVQISGTRAPTYTPWMAATGNEVFTLIGGADHLVFEGFDFSNVGTAFRLGADLGNIVIQHMEADNVRRFVENVAIDPGGSASVTGLAVRDVEVHGFSSRVVWLQYDTNNVVIERVFGDSEYQDKDGIAEGIHLDGTVHDVLIKDTVMMNVVRSSSGYWNGDGFATERGVYGVRFENTVARGNGDGGYDLKSTDTVLVNAVSEDNGRNFRLWGEIELINPTGIDPHKHGGTGGQYQVQTIHGAEVTITGGYFSDTGYGTKVVHSDSTGTITFSGTHFVHAGTLTVGSGILGIDMALVVPTAATGQYSTNGELYLEGGQTPPPPDDPPVLLGGAGNDNLRGSDAGETLNGYAGNDVALAGGGNDLVYGGTGNDRLFGGSGNDSLYGGKGSDQLHGEAGNDKLFGGENGDWFIFDNRAATGTDAIKDFGGTDRLLTTVALPDANNDGRIHLSGPLALFGTSTVTVQKGNVNVTDLDYMGTLQIDGTTYHSYAAGTAQAASQLAPQSADAMLFGTVAVPAVTADFVAVDGPNGIVLNLAYGSIPEIFS